MPRARLVALVFAGGVLGTAGREAIVLALPSAGGFPWGVLLVNLVGSFALGVFVAALGRRDETPRRRDVRLFVGTGVIGGFTTYSALATETVVLGESLPQLGLAYALISVVGGLVAAGLGVAVGGARQHPSREDADT